MILFQTEFTDNTPQTKRPAVFTDSNILNYDIENCLEEHSRKFFNIWNAIENFVIGEQKGYRSTNITKVSMDEHIYLNSFPDIAEDDIDDIIKDGVIIKNVRIFRSEKLKGLTYNIIDHVSSGTRVISLFLGEKYIDQEDKTSLLTQIIFDLAETIIDTGLMTEIGSYIPFNWIVYGDKARKTIVLTDNRNTSDLILYSNYYINLFSTIMQVTNPDILKSFDDLKELYSYERIDFRYGKCAPYWDFAKDILKGKDIDYDLSKHLSSLLRYTTIISI